MRISSVYYKQNIRIAFPIMLSLAGQAIVQMADNIMVGQLGAPELAAVSLAGAIIMNTMVVGMGIATGLTPLVGQAFALNDKERIAGFFQNSLVLNTAVALLLTLFLFILMPYLSMMGQPTEVVALCKGYYILTSLSVIPFILFMTFKQYMEGIGNTKVAMVITISCNVMNIFLNYIFIYGKFGAPFLGVAGAGLATLISRTMMPMAFFFYIHRSAVYNPVFRFFRMANTNSRKIKQLLQVGYPIAGQMVVEFLSLSLITVMMGWLGTIALAANQIVMSMISLTFMISSGIAGASTILVSHEYGRGNIAKVRRYAHASLRLAVVFPRSRRDRSGPRAVLRGCGIRNFRWPASHGSRSLAGNYRRATPHDLRPHFLPTCRRSPGIHRRDRTKLRSLWPAFRILWRSHVRRHPVYQTIQ